MGQHLESPADPKAQKRWIKQTAKEIQHDQRLLDTEEIMPEITDIPEYQSTSYRITAKSLIRCSNDDILVIQPHSSHQDEKIGDVSIAVTGSGKVWVNYSHICGGIIHFKNYDTALPTSSADFFQRFKGEDDHGKDGWVRWKKFGNR